jgi:hypothetical protein
MRQLLITIWAWGLLLAAVTATMAVVEATNGEIANVNTSQNLAPDTGQVTKKPRLRFTSKSGITKTCGGTGTSEGEIREAEKKRLKAQQQTKNSSEIPITGQRGGDD